ncbi:MAG TPA: hypothetical protein VFQ54_05455, partial [Thermomicrobiales bacterium]|nr:hypothetical protein [Thermomicrobiales bacterium]
MSTKTPRPVDPRSLEGIRDRFVNATSATIIHTTGGDFRISNLPLLREVDGGLEQVVRVRIPAGTPGTTVSARLLSGGSIVAEGSGAIMGTPESLLLFVPEVDDACLLDIEIRLDDVLLGSAQHEVTPQRKFTVHIVHHSHYDIGYTDPQSTVLEAQLNFIDYALELATLTDDWPSDAQFRWNIEVNWPLKHWLRTRPKHAREALLRRVKEGRFEVHALPFSMHTEAYAIDELAQQLAF